MPLEKDARTIIDERLREAGWLIQNYQSMDVRAGVGVAVREFPLDLDEVSLLTGRGKGFADYLLVVNGEAVGVLEAKREGTTLTSVSEQSARYQTGQPVSSTGGPRFLRTPLPFSYEATNNEILFKNGLDPVAKSREIQFFHRPETFVRWLWLAPISAAPQDYDLLRASLRYKMPPLLRVFLRDCQYDAILKLEHSLRSDKLRALIQMATGSGKTYTTVSAIYRLIKFGNAKRILFLVDRNNLALQTLNEFQRYVTPDDGRKFTDLYSVQHMTSGNLNPHADVYITTIQRLYSILTRQPEEELTDDQSLFDVEDLSTDQPKPAKMVTYNPALPIEFFELIFIDECHRSIYQEWQSVLEYFDAFLVGLTATPDVRSFAFFKRNLIQEYTLAQSIADGVNVDYETYRVRTQITEQGSRIERANVVKTRNKLTRERGYELLQDTLEYTGSQLDRDVVAQDQIRTVLGEYRDALFTRLFPGRHEVPKTLIFAKDDSHADDIVKMVREVFPEKANDFVSKITYRVTGVKPEDLIRRFRNSFHPRIAVTVDMISTGTDIRPLEVLIFMRQIRSRNFFEQMKGRGCRTILDDEFQTVTPDARTKTHFILLDAVGVTETRQSENPPLERKPSLPFERLLEQVAAMANNGSYDEDSLTTLASRLGRLARRLKPEEFAQIQRETGSDIQVLAEGMLRATDYDQQVALAQQLSGEQYPDIRALEQAALQLTREAAQPFTNPELRRLLIQAQRRDQQVIDDHSVDLVLQAGFDATQSLQAISSFRAEILKRQDEITAFELAFSQRREHPLTYKEVRALADAIQWPDGEIDRVWQAYQHLDASKVRGRGTKKLTTDIIALIRHTLQRDRDPNSTLEPYSEAIERRFNAWLTEQERLRQQPFTIEQLDWLKKMRDRVAASLYVGMEDFDFAPFGTNGRTKALSIFGGPQELQTIINDLNERLIA